MKNIISFTYTKDEGETSERVIYALEQPSAKYFGIDLSEMEYVDQNAFILSIKDIEAKKMEAIRNLMEEYDIKHNFRTFLPSKMHNVLAEEE